MSNVISMKDWLEDELFPSKKVKAMNNYDVYYMKPNWFRNGIFGEVPKLKTLNETHTFVKTVEAMGMADAWMMMQAEMWSPNGEARDLIRSLDLQHTSMSVGDIFHDKAEGKWFVVAPVGFVEIAEFDK